MSDEETQQGDAISTTVIDGKSSNKRGEVVGRLEFLDETGWLRCSCLVETMGGGVDNGCNSSRESSGDGIGC